jgi:hypothetical protein
MYGDDDDNMASMNEEMSAGFALHGDMISGHAQEPITDARYQELGGESVYDRVLSWGAATSADQDQIQMSERAKGIRRRCPDCEDGGCRGGSACVSDVNILTPAWDALFSTWCDRHQVTARKKLERFLASTRCSRLPSSSDLGPRLEIAGGRLSSGHPNSLTWDVFFEKLSNLWERMGDESQRRLWLARFYVQWRQAQAAEDGDRPLAKLESAWVGFALRSTVQSARTLISCESLCRFARGPWVLIGCCARPSGAKSGSVSTEAKGFHRTERRGLR